MRDIEKKSIVYATDHNFVLMCAVSMVSLIEMSKKMTEYKVYILVDETLTTEDFRVFDMIWEKYPEVTHEFIAMDESIFSDVSIKNSSLTKSTFYRLLLPGILNEADTCLYIDADTLIEGDLSELFSLDLNDDYIAGVLDPGMKTLDYCLDEIPDMDSYINAGILLMNLKKMREDNLEKKFFEILPNNYRFNDQDILNVSCYGRIKLLSQKYNQFSHYPDGNEKTLIRHLIGWGGCRPSQNKRAKLSKTWWAYADMFKEFECYKKISDEADQWYKSGSLRYVLDYCKTYDRVYLWGSKEVARRLAHALKYNGKDVLALVDNDSSCWGQKTIVPIISPAELEINENTIVINTAWGARDAIRSQIKALGASDEQVIDFHRRPAGFYTVLADEYRQEELEELYLWEYGTVRVE